MDTWVIVVIAVVGICFGGWIIDSITDLIGRSASRGASAIGRAATGKPTRQPAPVMFASTTSTPVLRNAILGRIRAEQNPSVNNSVHITSTSNDTYELSYGNIMGVSFDATLVLTPEATGTKGAFFVKEWTRCDGHTKDSDIMHQLNEDVRAVVREIDPSAEFTHPRG